MTTAKTFYAALSDFCRAHNVRQGYIPMFIAGMRDVELVGSCQKLENLDAPVWTKVYLEAAEAFGGGTLAYDPETDTVLPHVHVSAGVARALLATTLVDCATHVRSDSPYYGEAPNVSPEFWDIEQPREALSTLTWLWRRPDRPTQASSAANCSVSKRN